jgi:hypothetical protein
MSHESLKKIHTFALKNQNEEEKVEEDEKVKKPKVYYIEEHVKVLSEIIAQADPILTELSSVVYQFQKMASKKQSSKQRDIDLFERYGKEDFMAERDKLNISFHDLREVEQIQ